MNIRHDPTALSDNFPGLRTLVILRSPGECRGNGKARIVRRKRSLHQAALSDNLD